jgi:hypothetical protein
MKCNETYHGDSPEAAKTCEKVAIWFYIIVISHHVATIVIKKRNAHGR